MDSSRDIVGKGVGIHIIIEKTVHHYPFFIRINNPVFPNSGGAVGLWQRKITIDEPAMIVYT